MPQVVLVMGVSGTGKSTVGQALANARKARFLEGDDAHPRANVAKMARGIPLTDADRRPWLRALHGSIVASVGRGEDVVLACSALTRAYRKLLLGGDRPIEAAIHVVFLTAPRGVLQKRLAERRGHFFDPALLDDQLATLEPPKGDQALVLDATRPVDELVAAIEAWLPEAPPGDELEPAESAARPPVSPPPAKQKRTREKRAPRGVRPRGRGPACRG